MAATLSDVHTAKQQNQLRSFNNWKWQLLSRQTKGNFIRFLGFVQEPNQLVASEQMESGSR